MILSPRLENHVLHPVVSSFQKTSKQTIPWWQRYLRHHSLFSTQALVIDRGTSYYTLSPQIFRLPQSTENLGSIYFQALEIGESLYRQKSFNGWQMILAHTSLLVYQEGTPLFCRQVRKDLSSTILETLSYLRRYGYQGERATLWLDATVTLNLTGVHLEIRHYHDKQKRLGRFPLKLPQLRKQQIVAKAPFVIRNTLLITSLITLALWIVMPGPQNPPMVPELKAPHASWIPWIDRTWPHLQSCIKQSDSSQLAQLLTGGPRPYRVVFRHGQIQLFFETMPERTWTQRFKSWETVQNVNFNGKTLTLEMTPP